MSAFLMPHNREELLKALQLLKKNSGNCILAAGCTDLLVQHPSPLKNAVAVISLLECEEMRQIQVFTEENQDLLKIGCACTHSTVASSPLVQTLLPGLSQACGDIGSMQVRNRGTIGGSLGNASAAGDIYPVILACHGTAEVLCSDGTLRLIPAEDLILSPGKTVLAPDEVILSVIFPVHEHMRSFFYKLGERAHVSIAKLSLCISFQEIEGHIQNACAVIGAAGPKAFISQQASDYLNTLAYAQLKDTEVLQNLSVFLSDSIRKSIPNRASLAYKEQAVRGLVFSLAQGL